MAGSLLSSGYSQQQSRRDGDFFGGFFGARDESCYSDRSYPGCTSSHYPGRTYAADVHPGSAFSSHSSYDSYTASAWPHSLHPPPSQLEFAYGAAGAPALGNAQGHGRGYGHGVQRYDGYGNNLISAFHGAPAHGSQPLGGQFPGGHFPGFPGEQFPGGQFPGGHFPGGPAAPGVVSGGPAHPGSYGLGEDAAGADCCGRPSSRRPGGDHRRHRSSGCC